MHIESKKEEETHHLPSMLPSLANLPSGRTPFHLDKFASRNLVSSHNRNSHWLYKNHALTKVLFHVPGEKKMDISGIHDIRQLLHMLKQLVLALLMLQP